VGQFTITSTRIHQKNEISGWENIIINQIDLHTNNLKLNMFTNIKEVELYDLNMNIHQLKKTKHQFMIFVNKWMNVFDMKNFQQI
jgi:hypothetical protein